MIKDIVIGVDSGIGRAIYELLPDALGTSRRFDPNFIQLDIKDKSAWPVLQDKFATVYYCIGLSTDADETMEVNATRSIEFLQHIAPNVTEKVVVLTSILGALTKGNVLPADTASIYYRMSKAALNMGVMELSKQFENLNWQLVHPGFVRTKLTGKLSHIDQAVEPHIAATKIINLPIIKGLSYIELDVTGTRMVI